MSDNRIKKRTKTALQIALEQAGLTQEPEKPGKTAKISYRKYIKGKEKQAQQTPTLKKSSHKPRVSPQPSPLGRPLSDAPYTKGKNKPETDNRQQISQEISPRIVFNEQSRISETLLKYPPLRPLSVDYTGTVVSQLYEDSRDEIDLVMGLDLGTSYTKVVVMVDDTTRRSWAVPFIENANPYMIPSTVYRYEDCYRLEGDWENACVGLKMPLLRNQPNPEQLIHVIAFLALVIRQSRGWFLENTASVFHNNRFNWHYRIGLPASTYENKSLAELFRRIVLCAAIVARMQKPLLQHSDLIDVYARHFGKSIQDPDWPVHPDYVKTFPEIAAQLHGYIYSDKWDESRQKFMLVDIGGGTVDASIVNVIRSKEGELKYSFLRSRVEPIGATVLHEERLIWICDSLKASKEHDRLQKTLEAAFEIVPEEIPPSFQSYLENVEFPPRKNTIDYFFYNKYADNLLTNIIAPVKNDIDPKIEQWRSLQYFLCGGGSLHPLYRMFHEKMNQSVNTIVKLDIANIDVPDYFHAPGISVENFHRLSVAYGLSHYQLGELITETSVRPLIKTEYDKPEMIAKEMV